MGCWWPKTLQGDILKKIHEGHLGIEKCQARARQLIYWPNINNDIKNYTGQCGTCQRHRHTHANVNGTTRTTQETLAEDRSRFIHIHTVWQELLGGCRLYIKLPTGDADNNNDREKVVCEDHSSGGVADSTNQPAVTPEAAKSSQTTNQSQLVSTMRNVITARSCRITKLPSRYVHDKRDSNGQNNPLDETKGSLLWFVVITANVFAYKSCQKCLRSKPNPNYKPTASPVQPSPNTPSHLSER